MSLVPLAAHIPTIEEVTMGKATAGLGTIAILAIVFYLTDVPAWAWTLPALLLVAEAAMAIRARSIEAHR